MYNHYTYPSYAYSQTHPDRLATLGRLFGLSPAPVEGCRLLEIGCGSGGNLLPMAAHLPNSAFLGVDPAEVAIAEGDRHIRALGLDNLRFEAIPIERLDAEGAFDYIICHGVWSWVPESTQTAILKTCARLLTPHGVAAISYNVFPGWHQAGMLRSLLLRQRDPSASPEAQVRAARSNLKQLSEVAGQLGDSRAAFFARETKRWDTLPDAYLFYEYLASNNSPEWFEDFVQKASHHRLRYLCNGDLFTMWLSNQAEPVAAAMSVCSHIVEAQQTLDILTNRRFRTTLLCLEDAPVDMNLTPDRLDALWFRALFDGDPRLGPQEEGHAATILLRANQAITADVTGLGLRLVLGALQDAAPGALSWRELNSMTHQTPPEVLGEGLMRLAVAGFLGLHAYKAPVNGHPTTHPLASSVARWVAASEPIIANLWHEALPMSSEHRRLLTLLDGTQTVQMLADAFNGDPLPGLDVLRRQGFLMHNPGG